MPEPIKVWRFHDAPEELRNLSPHGGDEDWLALMPKYVVDSDYYYVGWLEPGTPFGVCDVSHHDLPNGDRVYIGAHA